MKEKHGSSYETPKLRFWARMVASNLHNDLDSPPQIPAFTGTASKRHREFLSDALSGAAVAFVKVFSDEQPNKSSNGQTHSSSNSTSLGVSPGKACELRMKNFEVTLLATVVR